jgi:hypothetical protein
VSYRQTNKVLYHLPRVQPGERLLLTYLADVADESGGRVYWSTDRLSAYSELSLRYVQLALRRFRERGWLIGTARKGYRLKLPPNDQLSLSYPDSPVDGMCKSPEFDALRITSPEETPTEKVIVTITSSDPQCVENAIGITCESSQSSATDCSTVGCNHDDALHPSFYPSSYPYKELPALAHRGSRPLTEDENTKAKEAPREVDARLEVRAFLKNLKASLNSTPAHTRRKRQGGSA